MIILILYNVAKLFFQHYDYISITNLCHQVFNI